ncbi:MarR family winged helix-turn-helix transcriptional regulator [Pedobacter sp. L105]|uniref:MarR family winged helix-turn-helix transcriptional regulator n=1 Tax=Pedobacter sp. L105 TaxID=1641871 RepID=UPI00131DBC32|nr:MarR family transcriptional regulator [Pedobacter sp. L105]
MNPDEKSEPIVEFCQSIFEFRFRLRKMFQVKLKEAGMTISFEVLEVMSILHKKGGINQQELADLLFKDKSSMTYLLDNMVKGGWVLRKEDEVDRRNKLIFLTDKSHQLKEELSPLVEQCFAVLSENITPQDIKEGMHTLSKMNNSLLEFII